MKVVESLILKDQIMGFLVFILPLNNQIVMKIRFSHLGPLCEQLQNHVDSMDCSVLFSVSIR